MSFNFGSTAVAAPAASSGFSFGASTATPAASTGGGSGGFSFGGGGGGATAAPAASSGGFSFGGQSATTTTNTTAAPSTGGGFSFGGGQPSATATAQPATTGFGVFGATATPASTGGGGFSFGGQTTSAATTTTTTGGGLFGSAGATATTTPSLFGTGATTGGSLFGGGGFGATQQQQQAQQQQQQQQPAITLETKFDTLPADVKKNMTDFHTFLKDEDQSDAFLKSVSARKLDQLKTNLDQLAQGVLVRRNFQDRQATAVHHVRKDVKHLIHQVDTATLNLRSMSGESTSQKFYGIMRRVEMPSPYYWELLDSFEARMEQIKSQIEQVESEYQPLYEKHATKPQQRSGGGGGAAEMYSAMDPARLQQLLLSQNAALIQVAAHVAEVHEKADEMRQAFIHKMKDDLRKRGEFNPATFKNPFDKKKRSSASRESDIDNIRFKTSVAPTIVASQQPQQPQQPQPQAATGFGFGNTTTGGGFGATTSTTTGSSLFGAAKPTITTGGFGATAAAPAATTGGFGFGSGATTTAAAAAQPKQVSFSLGGTTSAPPAISTGGFGATTSTPAASTGFGFGAPGTPAPFGVSGAAGGSGFGSVSSSFLPAGTPAFGAGAAATGDKRAGGSSGMRARQKKR